MIFVDTCILIDYTKGKIEISDSEFENYCINSIVQLEFVAGALDKRELKKINQVLSKFKLLEIDQDVLTLSVDLLNNYKLSHNMGIYDAIIASSCMIYELPLWTLNKKDFRFLEIELKN